jgi:hypothetical protein
MATDKGALFEGYGIPSRMAHPAEAYWSALANKDATTVASCCAPGATFHAPVFNLQAGVSVRYGKICLAARPICKSKPTS